MGVTATEAKNHTGSLCVQAKREAVFVEKDGQLDTAIPSIEPYEAPKAHHDKANRSAAPAQAHKPSSMPICTCRSRCDRSAPTACQLL